jgi:hypothetical protein
MNLRPAERGGFLGFAPQFCGAVLSIRFIRPAKLRDDFRE